MGPILEDLVLAYRQVSIELNSATDNPLIDRNRLRTIHGGNFQAMSITSAMEKVRQAAQSMGRMLFTQCTELINPAMSRGLPPNLVFAEPSESFVFKSTDILIASLLSELGYLANPIVPHVQTAEMGNQSLKSLALISARYAMDSLNILKQLAAAHLVAVCQALDLRVFQVRFLAIVHQDFHDELTCNIGPHMTETSALPKQLGDCWKMFTDRLEVNTSLDSTVRIPSAITYLRSSIMQHLTSSKSSFDALKACTERLGDRMLEVYTQTKDQYLQAREAEDWLGRASKRIYDYVRTELSVPTIGLGTLGRQASDEAATKQVIIGDLNEKVRGSMTEHGVYQVLVDCIRELDHTQSQLPVRTSKL